MNAKAWDEISKDYLAHIVSPFDSGTVNPLFRQLLSIDNIRDKTVADLGCGVGTLLPFLSRNFGRVVAIDFSSGMLRRARRTAPFPNVTFCEADMTDLLACFDLGRMRRKKIVFTEEDNRFLAG